jgi:hypothetical protein
MGGSFWKRTDMTWNLAYLIEGTIITDHIIMMMIRERMSNVRGYTRSFVVVT